jgi:hypothetical protein
LTTRADDERRVSVKRELDVGESLLQIERVHVERAPSSRE